MLHLHAVFGGRGRAHAGNTLQLPFCNAEFALQDGVKRRHLLARF